METDTETEIAELKQQVEILKGASYQGNLVRKRLQNALAILKQKDLELMESKQRIEEDFEVLKQMQEQLVEKEKMAALGSLVAGVAHEINTPVGVAITSISSCKEEISNLKRLYEAEKLSEEDMELFLETADESTQIVQNSLSHAARLIRSFKQISVDQNIDNMRQIDISEYIHDIIRTFHNQLKNSQIQVEIDCQDGLRMNTYPGSISQIFTNLLSNAISHAYDQDKPGRIFIQVRLGDDQLLHILFVDDGKGMDDTIRKQAFEPFVTTGRSKGGSGLGLNIVYNLVTHRFAGEIKLESEKGAGSRFTITLRVEPTGTQTDG